MTQKLPFCLRGFLFLLLFAGLHASSDPVILLDRTHIIYSPLNAYTLQTNEVIPGSLICVSLRYTNSGVGPATNFMVECEVDGNHAPYLTGSATTINGQPFFSTNGLFEGYLPSGKVDRNVVRIRFQIPFLAANGSGTLEFRLCVL